MKKGYQQRYAFLEVLRVPGQACRRVRVSCCQCSAHDELTLNNGFNPQAFAKKFAEMGWLSKGGQRVYCPRCAEKKRENGKGEALSEIKKIKPAPMDTLARQQRRRVMELLVEKFTDDGKWLGDWSDAKIAQETGIAESVVAQLREENFGQEVEPKELREMRAALDTVSGEFNELSAMVHDSKEKISKLEKQLQTMRASYRAA